GYVANWYFRAAAHRRNSRWNEKPKEVCYGAHAGYCLLPSIGSLGTLIGTPPNALLAGYMKEAHGITIGFGQWMLVGMPVAIVFTVIAWLVLITVFKPEMDHIPGGKELINDEVEKLGKWTGPQI